MNLPRANGCPKCHAPLHYSSGWDEQLCTQCYWISGEEYCSSGYLPENIYNISDYCTILGLLGMQCQLGQISRVDMFQLLDNMGIK